MYSRMEARGAAIIVFAQEAVPGEVLPGMAAAVGGEKAAALYGCFVADTLAKIQRLTKPTPYVAVWRTDAGAPVPQISPEVATFDVTGESMGQRLRQAIDHVLSMGHESAIVLMPTSPNLPLRSIHEALEHLRFLDLVLGPRENGGVYLVGTRGRYADFMTAVPWEDNPETESLAGHAILSALDYAVLDQWYSIETPQDLELLKQFLQFDVSEDNPCPHTAAWLKANR